MKRFSDRIAVRNMARWVHLSRRSYYYKAHPGPRGKKASTHTLHQGLLVPNESVVDFVREYFLKEEYCRYAYDMMTDELRLVGFLINKKKTYRLMDENHLLIGKIIRTHGKQMGIASEDNGYARNGIPQPGHKIRLSTRRRTLVLPAFHHGCIQPENSDPSVSAQRAKT